MKKLLLSTLLITAAAQAMAGDWVLPTPKTAELTYDQTLYFYNEGAHLFLTRGNSWGSQMSLGSTGLPVQVKEKATDYTDGGTYVMLYNAQDNAYFDQDANGTQGWVDRSEAEALTSEKAIWKLQINADGSFQFGVPNESKACEGQMFDTEDPANNAQLWAGWNGYTSSTEVIPCLDITSYDESGFKWRAVSEADYAAFIPTFEQRIALYQVLLHADELGISVPDDVAAVYNNEAATAEELALATEALNNHILKVELELNGESDVTSRYIVNPNFDNQNEGWSNSTGESWWNTDNFHYYPGSLQGESSSMSGYICRYVWSGGWVGNLNNDETSQTFYLPAGSYRLEADCVGLQEGDGADQYGEAQDWTGKVKGFYLFAQSDLGETRTAVVTDGKVPQHFKVEFLSAGSDVTVGLKIDDAFGSYLGGDNFRLYCTSLINSPRAVELMVLVQEVSAYLENFYNADDYSGGYFSAPFSLTLLDEAESLVERCDVPVKNEEEEACIALIAEAKELIARIDNEIIAYTHLHEAYAVADEAMQQGKYDELGEESTQQLLAYCKEMRARLDEADVDATQAQALMDGWVALLAQLIARHVNEVGTGMDVTSLLTNGSFTKGTEWYNGNGSQECPGWNGPRPWGYMLSQAPDEEGNFTPGQVEFYGQDFDFYQELHNMPAGVYTIQFRGLYRWGAKDDVIAAFGTMQGIERNIARFYLNDVEVPIQGIIEDAFALYEDEGEGGNYSSGITDAEGNLLYFPDANWYYYWRHNDTYNNVGAVVVGEEGVLRIGFKAQNVDSGSWAFISAPKLRYEGTSPAAYAAACELLAGAVADKRDKVYSIMPISNEMNEMPETLAAEAANVAENGTDDERAAMLATLLGKRKEMDIQLVAVANLIDSYQYYDDMKLNNESSAEFAQQMSEIAEAKNGQSLLWETNAQMADADHHLNALFTAGVQAKGAAATLESPYEMSVVVRNPDFYDELNDTDSAIYWEGATGTQGSEMYAFTGQAFSISQTIAGLPKGYYRLVAQGFDQNSSTAAQLFASIGESEWSAPLMDISSAEEAPADMEGAADSFGRDEYAGNQVDFGVEAESADVVIGIKKLDAAESDWAAFTHFQLLYLGETAPTSIESVATETQAVELYNLNGQRIPAMQRGINVVVFRQADGSVKVQKVMLK